jgi:signal transduction histidine kinase/DNA-binding response OmpR family regulator
MKKFWDSYVTNSHYFTAENEDYQRAYLYNSFLVSLVLVLGIFTYINHYYFYRYNLFYLDISGIGLALFSIILFKKTNNVFLSAFISNLGLMILVLAYEFILGPSHYAFVWFLLVPFLNYFLLKKLWGTILYMFFLVSNVAMFLYFKTAWEKLNFNYEDISNLIISSLFVFLLSIFFDISSKNIYKSLLNYEANARAANKSKVQFLAKMNREIRTPLNGIIGFTDLLNQTTIDLQQKGYLDNVNESSKALLGVVNDVLDYSQLEIDKFQLENIQAPIHDLLKSVMEINSYSANQKKIESVLEIGENMPDSFQADPARLKQILLYLTNNAVKFTDQGKVTLSVKFSPTNDYLGRFTFSVKDTGIGIAENLKPRLFDSLPSNSKIGVGLGLNISSKIVSKMGGELEFKSEEGVGSDFYFVIETSYKYNMNSNQSNTLSIKKVMLLDSDLNNRIILQENFHKWGVELVVVDNSKHAIQLLQESLSYDTVIIENEITKNEGLETIKIIRNKLNLNAKRLPIILLNSSLVDEDLRQSCENLEVKYILNKPVSASEFYQYLKNIKEETYSQKFVSSTQKKNLLKSIPYECTIVIAEDVKMSMLLIKTVINKMMPNAKVLTTENGLETIQVVQNNEVDLILMDVQMPEMNGLEATKLIRQSEVGTENHVPIIALTAGATVEEKNQCFEYGMDDYLSKPIHLDKLFDLLYKHFVN